jgi:hypothetical protein
MQMKRDGAFRVSGARRSPGLLWRMCELYARRRADESR